MDSTLEKCPVKEEEPVKQPSAIFGYRHLQAFLLFLFLTVAYMMRVNMSVAVVAMQNATAVNPDFDDFPDWTETPRSLILSSFFWGYVVTQIPAGQLGRKYGPRVLILISMVVCSLFTILTPIGARLGGWETVCALRVIQGLAQGFFFPSCHALLAQWAPPAERGRLATYAYGGSQFGTVLAMPLSGLLANSSLGWPSIFYVIGGLGILWSVLWFFLGANAPAVCKKISEEEKAYIQSSLGQTLGDNDKEKMPTPWGKIWGSLPMWSLLVAHCGHNWGFWTLLTEMPTYMNDILLFDLKSNSLLSALPYLMMFILGLVFSSISDLVIKRQILKIGTARKLFNTIGLWTPAVLLIGVGYVPQDQSGVAVALLTAAVGINSGIYSGFQVNHIDLSPNHAGTMMGITNGAANIISIIAPLIVGQIATDGHSIEQWRTVFFISSGIYFVGNLFFLLFGSAELQPWNEPEQKRDSEISKTSENHTAPSLRY
ncbi:putative inorganic phosphate cotransporter [Ctenocephalides felis]|uniref:putative inorganic phosphate cotransporter n=1 Tax=Ctenocephalides felis TaxID=7515 RepID=UPI000E6E5A01|nr:putative inorganic phosphate cotransporter [Ctenocephalides felis]